MSVLWYVNVDGGAWKLLAVPAVFLGTLAVVIVVLIVVMRAIGRRMWRRVPPEWR